MTREEKMGATKDQSLIVHTRKNYKKKERKENFHHNKKKEKKKKSRYILQMFNSILVMKRNILQYTVP